MKRCLCAKGVTFTSPPSWGTCLANSHLGTGLILSPSNPTGRKALSGGDDLQEHGAKLCKTWN